LGSLNIGQRLFGERLLVAKAAVRAPKHWRPIARADQDVEIFDGVKRGVALFSLAIGFESFVVRVRAGGGKLLTSPRLDFRLNQYPQMSIKAKPKRRGRPATGRDPMMGFRASPVLRASIVRWAENQADIPTLSEATRRLVELGLKVKK
jgi:hypothetical protein